MFKALKKYNYIVVTGCQRSGTRITAKAIAQDTGFEYVDEFKIGVYDFLKLVDLLKGERKVIQAPCLCGVVHYLRREDILIVFMHRSDDDIRASQEKRNWPEPFKGSVSEQADYNFPSDIVAVKKEKWKLQKLTGINSLDLEYETLRNHPLWVEDREHFATTQTA